MTRCACRDKEGGLKPKVMEAVCFLAERITSASIVAAATVNHWVALGLEERARAQCDTDPLSDELPQLWEEDQCLGEICHEQDSIWRL